MAIWIFRPPFGRQTNSQSHAFTNLSLRLAMIYCACNDYKFNRFCFLVGLSIDQIQPLWLVWHFSFRILSKSLLYRNAHSSTSPPLLSSPYIYSNFSPHFKKHIHSHMPIFVNSCVQFQTNGGETNWCCQFHLKPYMPKVSCYTHVLRDSMFKDSVWLKNLVRNWNRLWTSLSIRPKEFVGLMAKI